MPSSTLYTHVVYQNKKIAVRARNDFRRVIATTDIKKGSLLLIEHLATDITVGQVNGVRIMSDRHLFESLHPRTTSWNAEVMDNKAASIEKHKFNSFGESDHDKYKCKKLGCTLSMFNHSSHPNAQLYFIDASSSAEPPPKFALVFLAKSIVAGEEISITYYCDEGEVHPYCNKATDSVPTIKPPQVMLDMAKQFVNDYQRTITFAGICVRLHLSGLGFLLATPQDLVFPEFTALAKQRGLTIMDLVKSETNEWIKTSGWCTEDWTTIVNASNLAPVSIS